MNNEMVKYKLDSGELMELTKKDVLDIVANGQGFTDQEITKFLWLCKAHRLNPFIREAYIVKYGNAPATIITSKDVFTKRAFQHPKFSGFQAGITFFDADGNPARREGSMLLEGEKLVGGWCKCYLDGYANPMYDEVSLKEYSTGKSNWSSKPATMIRKVALVHTLREAFPEEFGGLYDADEMGADEVSSDQPTTKSGPAPAIEAEIVDETPDDLKESRAYLGELMRKAKQVDIKISAIKQWAKEKYGKDITDLDIDSTEDVILYVQGLLNDKATLAQADEPDAAGEILPEDIPF